MGIINAPDDIFSVAFSPDGKTLASAGYNHPFKLWNFRTGTEVQKFTGVSIPVSTVFFKDDGNTLVTVQVGNWNYQYPTTYKFWDVRTEREVKAMTYPYENNISSALSPDFRTRAIGRFGGDEGFIFLVEAQTGQILKKVSGNDVPAVIVAFSPDGQTLVSGDRGRVKLWDVSFLYPELANVLSPIEAEKAVELNKLFPLTKNEFETDAEFQVRRTKILNDKKAIEEKYALKQSQAKKAYLAKKELDTLSKIKASRTEVTLKISEIGIYDANNETFPITIEAKTRDIRVPRVEAQIFKERWQSLVVMGFKQLNRELTEYEYVDLVIVRPETGTRYPFVD